MHSLAFPGKNRYPVNKSIKNRCNYKMFIADFHLHSKYSRATSKACVPEMLAFWGRRKGIDVIGTGDFTHPAWREELKEKLIPSGEGLYTLKDDFHKEDRVAGANSPQFIVSGEISSIYKKNGRVRKVHNLIILPGLEHAESIAHRLEAIGNLHSDGRPILGLDSRDLLEIVLDLCPEAIFIPAHIWTPHFSIYGAYSGFDDIEECFEDLTGHIYALETGLSSDPPMNWRLSALDDFTLVSNSDAHSPPNLGREANIFNTELSYQSILRALKNRNTDEFYGTIEFFPQEGKYHYDGHRACKVCWKPEETIAAGGLCPVCGGRITVGVLHRVEALADREEGFVPPAAKHFESLIPLPEIIAASLGCSVNSKKVKGQYDELIRKLGPEFFILREAPLQEIEMASGPSAGPYIAESIRRLRCGKVQIQPGFDGQFGRIKIIDQGEIDKLSGQLCLIKDSENAVPVAETGSDENSPFRKSPLLSKAIEGRSVSANEPKSASRPEKAGKTEKAKRTEKAERPELKPESKSKSKPGSKPELETKPIPKPELKPGAGSEAKPALVSAKNSQPNDGADTLKTVFPKSPNMLYGLNAEQWEAVTSSSLAMAVIAGPGTGKTKTLVSRIAYLVEKGGAHPSQVTAVTFTNKAANEMRLRLDEHFGNRRTAAAMNIGTFHSICLQILSRWRDKHSIVIIDEYHAAAIIEEILKELKLKISPREALREISLFKNGALPKDDVERSNSTLVYDYYCSRLERYGIMDYDDMLLTVLHRFEQMKTGDEAGRSLEDSFSYLLVDEFQDINELQYRLIKAWGRKSRGIFIIGDPEQSIYAFRGSDMRFFERFNEDFSAVRQVRLTQNYRSTPEIITSAKAVIAKKTAGGPACSLVARRESGAKVRLIESKDTFSEAIFIAKEINRIVGGIDMLDAHSTPVAGGKRPDAKHSRGFSEIAVLYRTNRQAEILEHCFLKEGIGYVVVGREEFLGDKHVREATAFFRFLLNPGDIASLLEYLKLVFLKAEGGYTTELCQEILESYAAGKKCVSSLVRIMDGSGQALPKLEQIRHFLEMLRKYEPIIAQEKPSKIIESWIKDNKVSGIKSMELLLHTSLMHHKMSSFMQNLVLGRESDLVRSGGKVYSPDAVSLMTLHAAKGLEFPIVFICSVNDGLIPLRNRNSDFDMEEERRLLYVGMTRAKDELILLTSGNPSPFIADILDITEGQPVRETVSMQKQTPQYRQASLLD